MPGTPVLGAYGTGPAAEGEFSTWMDLALAEAAAATAHNDVPVGAVIVDASGAVIASVHNRREVDRDPLGHAELLAIRAAAEVLGRWRLDGCTLVVTLEPCAMCAGALVSSRIDRVVYGAFDEKAGAAGSVWDLLRDRNSLHNPEVHSGVRVEAAAEQLKAFFAAKR